MYITVFPSPIQDFLQAVDSTAIRILGDTPNSILDPKDYLGSIRVFVSTVESTIRRFRPDSQTSFLAVNIYPGRYSYFVLDLDKVGYNYETAHQDMRLIPVYVLRLSNENPTTIPRQPVLDRTIATTVATMHKGMVTSPYHWLTIITKFFNTAIPEAFSLDILSVASLLALQEPNFFGVFDPPF